MGKGTLFEVGREGAEEVGGGEESFFLDIGLRGVGETEDNVPVASIKEARPERFATNCVGSSG